MGDISINHNSSTSTTSNNITEWENWFTTCCTEYIVPSAVKGLISIPRGNIDQSEVNFIQAYTSGEWNQYIWSIIIVPGIILGMLLMWILLIFLFMCLGPKRVGFWSGSNMIKPVGEDSINKKTGQRIPYRRPKRVRICFILFSILLLIFTATYTILGVGNLQNTTSSLLDATNIASNVTKDASQNIKSLSDITSKARMETDSLLIGLNEISISNNENTQKIIPSIAEQFVSNDGMIFHNTLISVDDTLRELHTKIGTIEDNIQNTTVVIQTANNALSNQPYYCIPIVVLVLLLLISLILVSCTELSKHRSMERFGYCWSCITQWLIMPLFIIMMILFWIFGCTIFVTAIMNADMCQGTPPPSSSQPSQQQQQSSSSTRALSSSSSHLPLRNMIRTLQQQEDNTSNERTDVVFTDGGDDGTTTNEGDSSSSSSSTTTTTSQEPNPLYTMIALFGDSNTYTSSSNGNSDSNTDSTTTGTSTKSDGTIMNIQNSEIGKLILYYASCDIVFPYKHEYITYLQELYNNIIPNAQQLIDTVVGSSILPNIDNLISNNNTNSNITIPTKPFLDGINGTNVNGTTDISTLISEGIAGLQENGFDNSNIAAAAENLVTPALPAPSKEDDTNAGGGDGNGDDNNNNNRYRYRILQKEREPNTLTEEEEDEASPSTTSDDSNTLSLQPPVDSLGPLNITTTSSSFNNETNIINNGTIANTSTTEDNEIDDYYYEENEGETNATTTNITTIVDEEDDDTDITNIDELLSCTEDDYQVINDLEKWINELDHSPIVLKNLINTMSCHRVSPAYSKSVNEALCTYNVTALTWLMMSMLSMSICGFVMITLRSAVKPVMLAENSNDDNEDDDDDSRNNMETNPQVHGAVLYSEHDGYEDDTGYKRAMNQVGSKDNDEDDDDSYDNDGNDDPAPEEQRQIETGVYTKLRAAEKLNK